MIQGCFASGLNQRTYVPEFIEAEAKREELAWFSEALREWKEKAELPPGCVLIRFDAWLLSPERCEQLSHLFAFVAKKIRTTMPATEAVMADEAERVQRFIAESGAQTNAGVPPKGE